MAKQTLANDIYI